MLNNKNLYEFNKGTLAILPNGKESSLIYEDDSRYIIDDNPLNIDAYSTWFIEVDGNEYQLEDYLDGDY